MCTHLSVWTQKKYLQLHFVCCSVTLWAPAKERSLIWHTPCDTTGIYCVVRSWYSEILVKKRNILWKKVHLPQIFFIYFWKFYLVYKLTLYVTDRRHGLGTFHSHIHFSVTIPVTNVGSHTPCTCHLSFFISIFDILFLETYLSAKKGLNKASFCIIQTKSLLI